jgi:glucose/arabinose dehydrogenase
MHQQFPDQKFIVRNLGFAGDTPAGWSRASFDPPAKGWERLKEQLALVQPTVAFIGYGMAASLQEMTDRSADPSINPDPVRYGSEPTTAARFKGELAQLMDAIVESSKVEGREPKALTSKPSAVDSRPSTGHIRFVLLSPIRHEDLRQTRRGLPDPSAHNKLLEQYSKAIEDLAKERGAEFVDLFSPGAFARLAPTAPAAGALTDNGIHLSESGYRSLAGLVARRLGWSAQESNSDELRAAVLRKNELFFHRWRPANSTYLFGFRKYEQGQNAVEIPKFDPLIEQAEVEINRLKKARVSDKPATPPTTASASSPAVPPSPALPQFTIQDGFKIELWAENPLLEKPTQMNWDAQGRLWICSSSLYPQIAPGEVAHDKILVLEDADGDGKAEKSTVFVDGLLIPTGVEPDAVETSKAESRTSKAQNAAAPAQPITPKPSTFDGRPSTFSAACYVGQSTELLHFRDSDGDGKADEKRIVLSGFGTEDTHHIIHALHWGPDGRLYFNQSVYIHSHLETPYGMVRLNSGGIFAYDPRTERVEVFARGWWNSWGHQMDKWGQSFATDGAGSTGISWIIPGAVFPAYEGSRRIAPAISPGSYPKFCGLEIVYSPHFPSDWQGNAITCDFRAHRIVRFTIEDLSMSGAQPVTDDAKSAEGRRGAENAGRIPDARPIGGSAGYTAKEMPDFIRTSDISFRPIDVKLGPDGALYIADWSNPVINHGEVDFRDPRRDKHRGRIWRVTKNDAPLAKWERLAGKKNEELMEKLLSANLWEKEQARRVLLSGATGQFDADLLAWSKRASSTDEARVAVLPILSRRAESSINVADVPTNASPSPQSRAYAARAAGELLHRHGSAIATPDILSTLSIDPNARVRLEAVRALAQSSTAPAAAAVLNSFFAAKKNSPGNAEQMNDPFLEYATWLSINELARPWTEAIISGAWKTEGREQQLAWGLAAIEPTLAGATISKLFAEQKIPLDGSGPWFELLGKAGGPKELAPLYRGLLAGIVRDGDPVSRGAPGIGPESKFTPAVARRAAAALVEAARVRNVKPESPLASGQLAHWPLLIYGQDEALPDILRMVGYWQLDELAPFVASNAEPQNPPAVHDAVFESLRLMGGKLALQTTESFLGGPVPDQSLLRSAVEKVTPEIRRRALITLASLDPKRGSAHLSDVLGPVTQRSRPAHDVARTL